MFWSLVLILATCITMQTFQKPQQSRPLSASEALAASMLPFEQLRAQPDDLTEADRRALAVGREHAERACQALNQGVDQNPPTSDLLALGRLCLFGQQFDLARKDILKYLSISEVKDKSSAKMALARAFLGTGDAVNAAIQTNELLQKESLSKDLYILGMDIIDSASLRQSDFTGNIGSLCDSMISDGIQLLNDPPDKRPEFSASEVYSNSLRCIQVLAVGGLTTDARIVQQITELPKSSSVTSSLEVNRMEDALVNFQAAEKPLPFTHIDGVVIGRTGTRIPKIIDITKGSWLLLASAVWTPSTGRVVSELLSAAPQLNVIVLTSDSLNIGLGSSKAEQEAELLAFAFKFSSRVKVVKVTDEQIKLVGTDNLPFTTTIVDGVIKMKTSIDGETAERLLLLSMGLIQHVPSLKQLGR